MRGLIAYRLPETIVSDAIGMICLVIAGGGILCILAGLS
ncbi:hypothetical protein SAMN05444339_10244 [Loktanella atrilutea]|uniref:Uncharacterized protein n=1 Tax=Loktanella atrilutea TaxID=366533 RepID=A0A1M4WAK6_LOKAT|nr:hypothetical protein SAMN05444339_10244 [Loktanella atrilutea]